MQRTASAITNFSPEDNQPLARRGSATAQNTLVERIGSCTSVPWESWEHPANIPLHPPPQHPSLEPLDDTRQQEPRQLTAMLRESRQ